MRKIMYGRVGVVIGALVAVFVLGLLVFTAQGAPSAPGIQLNQTYNPSVTQTYQIAVSSQLYGLQSSNSVALFGASFVVTVEQGTTNIVFQERYAAGFTGYAQAGNPMSAQDIRATISVSVPAACSGVCSNENLTVTAYAIVQTYTVAWVSPTTTVVFVNSASSASGVPAAPASYASYSLEFWTPLLLLIAIVAFAVWATGPKHPIALAIGALAALIMVVQVFLAMIWLGLL